MKNLRKSKQTKTNVDLSKPFDLPVVDGDSFVDEIYFENLDKDEIRGMLKTNDINDVIEIIAEETNCKSKGLVKLWLKSI